MISVAVEITASTNNKVGIKGIIRRHVMVMLDSAMIFHERRFWLREAFKAPQISPFNSARAAATLIYAECVILFENASV
jgi:hypothetical protein